MWNLAAFSIVTGVRLALYVEVDSMFVYHFIKEHNELSSSTVSLIATRIK